MFDQERGRELNESVVITFYMGFESPDQGFNKQESSETINRAVAIDGRFLARELSEYSLHGHSQKGLDEGSAMLGNDAFTEIYFETKSGNLYKIYQTDGRDWALADARSNKGKGKEASGMPLSEQDLENGVLKIGKSFEFGHGGKTTEITGITCIGANRVYDAEYLKKITEGHSNDVRERFRKIISPIEKRS